MGNKASAKGNPASKRMSNPNNKNKRLKNKNKNEKLRAEGQHPKQLRNKANLERHAKNVEAENANQAPHSAVRCWWLISRRLHGV